MAAKELGKKHVCWKCGTRFYDLRKPAPLCPKCGTDARQAPAPKPSAAPERKARPPARPNVAEELDLGTGDLEKELEEEGLDDELEEMDDEG